MYFNIYTNIFWFFIYLAAASSNDLVSGQKRLSRGRGTTGVEQRVNGLRRYLGEHRNDDDEQEQCST